MDPKHKFGTHLCNQKLNSPTFLFQRKLGSPNKNRNSFYHNMISGIQVPMLMLGPKTIALLFSNHWNSVNKHKGIMRESEFQHNKHMETAHCLSSVAISTVFCFWFLLSIMSPSCETHMGTSPIDVQTLRKEHGAMAIWTPLLELLGFMVVVCGVAILMVSGKKFSVMQNAMFLFWAISMNLVPLLKKHYCF
ncbi:hypothetical protein PIB30_041497 [Stylosanthes scabra]|nr:hypothetical protein [Stylosanthes scabra]